MKRNVNPLLQTLLETGLSEKKARRLMKKLADRIVQEVRFNGRARWPGLGVFHLTGSKERRVTNPKTKEPMTLPASKRVRFRASNQLRALLKKAAF